MDPLDSPLIQIEERYFAAIGRAVYYFAAMEWSAVNVAQKIGENGHNPFSSRGYVINVSRKTVDTIAKDLRKIVCGISDQALIDQLKEPVHQFARLVEKRNALMHAHPGSSTNSDERLFRNGNPWTIREIDELSDEFNTCCLRLNRILLHVL